MNDAAQQWLVFSAENHAFAFQSSDVIEIIRVSDLIPNSEPIPGVLGWVNSQGKTLAVVDLIENLYKVKKHYLCNEIIVVKGKEKTIGVAVEKLLAVMQPGTSSDLDCLTGEASRAVKGVRYLKAAELSLTVQ